MVLRETLWLKAMGPDYISRAYGIAYDFDSKLTLTYNDSAWNTMTRKRAPSAVLCCILLIKLRKERVQVHAIGLQSHLQVHRPLGGQDFVNFLKMVRKLGLNVYVTELDVDTSHVTHRSPNATGRRTELRRQLSRINRPQRRLARHSPHLGPDRPLFMLRQYDHSITGALPLDQQMNAGPCGKRLRRRGWGSKNPFINFLTSLQLRSNVDDNTFCTSMFLYFFLMAL